MDFSVSRHPDGSVGRRAHGRDHSGGAQMAYETLVPHCSWLVDPPRGDPNATVAGTDATRLGDAPARLRLYLDMGRHWFFNRRSSDPSYREGSQTCTSADLKRSGFSRPHPVIGTVARHDLLRTLRGSAQSRRAHDPLPLERHRPHPRSLLAAGIRQLLRRMRLRCKLIENRSSRGASREGVRRLPSTLREGLKHGGDHVESPCRVYYVCCGDGSDGLLLIPH